MSKRYTADYKQLVLKLLRLNKGDVIAVAHFANVPERTLRDWQREERESAARRRAVTPAATPTPQRRSPPS